MPRSVRCAHELSVQFHSCAVRTLHELLILQVRATAFRGKCTSAL